MDNVLWPWAVSVIWMLPGADWKLIGPEVMNEAEFVCGLLLLYKTGNCILGINFSNVRLRRMRKTHLEVTWLY